jgi:hypothetical protein
LLRLVLHPAMPALGFAPVPPAVLLLCWGISTASAALGCHAAAVIAQSMHVADRLLLLREKPKLGHCIEQLSNRKSDMLT